MNLTDYLSRNPISPPAPEHEFEEEYAINCIAEFIPFINRKSELNGEWLSQSQQSTGEPKRSENGQSQENENDERISVNKISNERNTEITAGEFQCDPDNVVESETLSARMHRNRTLEHSERAHGAQGGFSSRFLKAPP